MDWIAMNLGPIFQSMAEVEENSADVEKASVINIAIIDFNSGSSVNYVIMPLGMIKMVISLHWGDRAKLLQ